MSRLNRRSANVALGAISLALIVFLVASGATLVAAVAFVVLAVYIALQDLPYFGLTTTGAGVLAMALGIVGVGLYTSGNATLSWVGLSLVWGIFVVSLAVIGRPLLLHAWYSIKLMLERVFKGKGDLHRAMNAALQGRPDESMQLLMRYDSRCPDDPVSQAVRSGVLLNLGRYDEALEAANRPLSIGETTDGRGAKGTVMLMLGALDHATAELRRGIQLAPASLATGARAGLAIALTQQRRLSEALEVLEHDRSVLKSSFTSYCRGDIHRLLGNEQAAVKHYAEACKRARLELLLSPQFVPILVCAQARAGKLEEAEKAAAQLPETGVSPSPLYARALLALKQERYIEARDALQRLIRVVPHEVVVALEDPDFAVLLRDYNCEELLAEARGERERILESIRRRIRPAPDPDAGPAYDTGGLRP